jgi:hypothetical protein
MTYLIVLVLALVAGVFVVARLRVLRRSHRRKPIPRRPRTLPDLVRQARAALSPWRAGPGPDAEGVGRGSVVATYVPGQRGRSSLDQAAIADGPNGSPGYLPQRGSVRTATKERPLGLAVAAISTTDGPAQDVHYVQANVIALARGIRPTGIDRRAATLALSAVMSSGLERATDVLPALRESVTAANRVVRSISSRDPEHSGMVATLDVILFAPEETNAAIYLAHVGNSSIWLHKPAAAAVQLLSAAHALEGGMLLRAVGLSQDVVPDTNHAVVENGDRFFLTTTSPSFSFTPETLGDIVLAYSGESIRDCAYALAEFAKGSGSPESTTVVAAEVARSAMFWGG